MLSLYGGCECPPPSCLCARTTSDTVTNRGTNCQRTSKERDMWEWLCQRPADKGGWHSNAEQVPRAVPLFVPTALRYLNPRHQVKHLARVLVYHRLPRLGAKSQIRQTETNCNIKETKCNLMPFPSKRMNPFKSFGEDFLIKTNTHVQRRAREGGICQRSFQLAFCCL